MSGDPGLHAVAPTMLHDLEVMGELSRGGTIPEEPDLVRAVAVPTLVVAGGASPDFFRDTATRIVELLAEPTYAVLGGHDHRRRGGTGGGRLPGPPARRRGVRLWHRATVPAGV